MNPLKKLIPQKYKRVIKENLGVPSLHWSLENLKKLGFKPSMIIDIGAYEGHWTKEVIEIFPFAKILMVEAQRKKEQTLEEITTIFPNVEYYIGLLSSTTGEEKYFFEGETTSHVMNDISAIGTLNKLKTETLDNILVANKIQLPDFLKLDVQGHELEVLKGGENALAHAEICLLEISLMDLGDKTPLLAQVVSFMAGRNFQAYDISQFMRRPFDKALYQLDMFFVRKDSHLLNSKRWK